MRRSPLYRRPPQPVGMRMPRSPARAAQPQEPTIARIAADALDNYMARADAVPAWVFATDDGGAPPPDQPDCDALYGALGLSGAITATLSAAERQSLWSRATFLRRVGEILGRFEFVDAAGRPVSGPGDPDVRAARFVPADADTVAAALIARWPDVFDDVADALAWARRLWRCAASPATRQPGENFRAALVAAEAQASGERSALNRYAADIGRVRLVTAANEPLFLQQPPSPRVAAGPDAPPLQYYLQEINGDGACFYRSIASALVQRLTGINLGRGATFSRDVQSGVSDAWATEDYGGLVRAGGPPNDVLALLLNGVAKWVKFYVYLVMCSDDIPPDAVTYVGGVTGIGRIEPMTSIDEMVAPGAARRIMGEAAGDAGDGDDVAVVIYRPPTLDLVVRYVVWLYEALANTMVGGRQTLSWAEVRPYALPLLAVPWDAAGLQRTLPADKTILFHDCQEADTVDVDLALLLQDSSAEYVAALAAGGDVDAAYRTYCNVMRQSVRWAAPPRPTPLPRSSCPTPTRRPSAPCAAWSSSTMPIQHRRRRSCRRPCPAVRPSTAPRACRYDATTAPTVWPCSTWAVTTWLSTACASRPTARSRPTSSRSRPTRSTPLSRSTVRSRRRRHTSRHAQWRRPGRPRAALPSHRRWRCRQRRRHCAQ